MSVDRLQKLPPSGRSSFENVHRYGVLYDQICLSICHFVELEGNGIYTPKMYTLFCLVQIKKCSYLTSCVFWFVFLKASGHHWVFFGVLLCYRLQTQPSQVTDSWCPCGNHNWRSRHYAQKKVMLIYTLCSFIFLQWCLLLYPSSGHNF